MSNEVFRGVNRYIDLSTGTEHIEYTRPYDTPTPAKSMATRMRKRFPWVGLNEDLKPAIQRSTYLYHTRESYYRTYDYMDTWTERAVRWERA